jgi:hypothetical protein
MTREDWDLKASQSLAVKHALDGRSSRQFSAATLVEADDPVLLAQAVKKSFNKYAGIAFSSSLYSQQCSQRSFALHHPPALAPPAQESARDGKRNSAEIV